MKHQYRKFIYILVLLVSFFISACGQNSRTASSTSHINQLDDSLVNYNKRVMQSEDQEIDDFIARYGWKMNKTSTGLRYLVYRPGNGLKATTGKKATLNYELKLLTGDLCYHSDSTGPIEFIIGHGGIASGLEEGILLLHEGDHVKLIIPSYLGYGLLGDQNRIPPRATLLYDLELVKLSDISK